MRLFFEETNNKIYMFYGDLDDIFITKDLQQKTAYSYLTAMLKKEGYERVIFYTGAGNYGKFALDTESAMVSFNQNAQNNPNVTGTHRRPGRISGSRRRGTAIGDAVPELREESDIEVVYCARSMTEGFFKDEVIHWMSDDKKTAVIFCNMWDFLTGTPRDTARAFSELMMNSWERGGAKDNLYIFLYNRDINNVADFSRVAGGLGVDSLFVRTSEANVFDSARVNYVGLPEGDEIENLLNYLRVVGEDGVKIDFEYDTVPRLVQLLLFYSRQCEESQKSYEDLRSIKARLLIYAKSAPHSRAVISEQVISKLYNAKEELENPLKKLKETEGWESAYNRVNEFVEEAKCETDSAESENNQNDNEKRVPLAVRRFGLRYIVKNAAKCPNFALFGNPGVGKSEIARLIGKILNDAGILEIGHTVEVTKNDLVSQYVGGTPSRTMEQIKKAEGGVLFVDEAHLLFEDSNDDSVNYCREAISTLVGAMTNPAHNFCLILAGYPEGVKKMIESDPGLSSRITEDNFITIDNYSIDLLTKIFRNHIEKKGYSVSEDILDKLENYIELKTDRQDRRTFGNARTVIGWADNVIRSAKIKGRTVIGKEDFSKDERELLTKTRKDNIEAVFAEVDEYTGFEFMKDIIGKENLRITEEKEQSGTKSQPPHMIFVGNPGTGKTTGAKLICEFYGMAGILGGRTPVELNASDLLSGNYKELLDKALDDAINKQSVLFIDEAHNLIDSPYGVNAIRSLMNPMTEKPVTVIFAVYQSRYDEFIKLDGGLEGRVKVKHFPDYTGEQLTEIFEKAVTKTGYDCSDCLEKIGVLWRSLYKTRRPGFANARAVHSLISEMHENRRTRCIKEGIKTGAELMKLCDADIPQRYIEIINANSAANTFERVMEEIDGYVGWNGLKEILKDIYKAVAIKKKYPKISIEPEPGHFFFTGPPGVGKSTAAKLLAKALFSMGLIGVNSCTVVSAKDLVAGFVGQTSMKTAEVIEKARHGLLFIDEAYALTGGGEFGGNSFNEQAINELVGIMDDPEFRSDSCIVFAGYKKDMQGLYDSNEGLKSRVMEIEFDAFDAAECCEIFKGLCLSAGLKMGNGVYESCMEIFEGISDNPSFANGRTVRRVFNMAVGNRNDRIFNADYEENDEEVITIYDYDIPQISEVLAVL